MSDDIWKGENWPGEDGVYHKAAHDAHQAREPKPPQNVDDIIAVLETHAKYLDNPLTKRDKALIADIVRTGAARTCIQAFLEETLPVLLDEISAAEHCWAHNTAWLDARVVFLAVRKHLQLGE